MKNGKQSGEVGVSIVRKQSAYASAIARHISADGCQFVTGSAGIVEGQRFRFAPGGLAPISGTVRWVVGDRAGFAFDRPIPTEAQATMRQHRGIVEEIDLYLC
jgi:hypothetical protein